MQRMERTSHTREQCLRRAGELDWLADNAPSAEAAAQLWAEARMWRSLALVARPAGTAGGGAAPGQGEG